MNFETFRYYIIICKLINVKPDFKGLHEFEKYYWECEYSGKSKLGKASDRYV